MDMMLFKFDVVGKDRKYVGTTIRLWAKDAKDAIERFQELMGYQPFVLEVATSIV